jgi:hypothetical protein
MYVISVFGNTYIGGEGVFTFIIDIYRDLTNILFAELEFIDFYIGDKDWIGV